ncbi:MULTISPECIES: hypothetical protein [unclassified Pseudomonas]|nr:MULTISPECIES: hypothetical protein [unclassified Pseudomonas]TWC06641.1 hypothetical protein FBY00_1513 [Pseudomonas sp. SJZ075]TWC26623.1 hypothetical protein FBY02_1503 [Pseudomonas sp. SJZ078]TWC45370.1 hypothetical protein FBY11_15220 [Pseudomonas sp. SJZ124]TWC46138.1 hypothetical protein FBY04_13340 [Pseudomonas sp. SJZ080]TWC80451.1 hypothetical protein FBY09_15021 [Pseudomonas sp. SJZ101]
MTEISRAKLLGKLDNLAFQAMDSVYFMGFVSYQAGRRFRWFGVAVGY